MLRICVPLVPPSVNHYVKHTRSGRHYKTKESLAFKNAVEDAWTEMRLTGRSVEYQDDVRSRKKPRYHVHVTIFLGYKQKLDIDNGLKVVLDGLKDAEIIHSDAAVTALSVAMGRDAERPRTEIEVEVL